MGPIHFTFREHDGDAPVTDKPHCGDCDGFEESATDKPHCGGCDDFGESASDTPHCGGCAD